MGKGTRGEDMKLVVNLVDETDRSYVAIPHQKPPFIVDAREFPPVDTDGDAVFAGDDDLHGWCLLTDASDYVGHQKFAMRALGGECLGIKEQF